MKRFATFASLVLFMALGDAVDVAAGDTHHAVYNGRNTIYGEPVATTKAAVDTIYLLGGPNRGDGDFEAGAAPSWDGWTHVDMTLQAVPRWQVSDWNNPGTGNGVWCGEIFGPCGPGDPEEGYGNHWREWLDFYGDAPDPTVSTNVRVRALMNYDTASVEDFVYLELEGEGLMYIMGHWSGSNKDDANVFTPVEVDEGFSVETREYVGPNHDQIHLRWEFISDDTGSDEDCLYPTYGACTIDNIVVSFNDVVVSTTDFEDETLGDWALVFPPPVGDFAKVWPLLSDLDRFVDNNTPQVAFIDDGLVVPGTGGTLGVTWIYGPGGFVVNLNGGLAGPGNLLHNRIMSPVLDWPAGNAGARLGFDAYMHLPYENRLFTQWWLRTSADGGVTWWTSNDQWLWYDDARYRRFEIPVAVYTIPGANKAQVCLDVIQLEPLDKPLDPTPAPYFDNVCFKVYPLSGPAMAAPGYALLQDNFPEIGIIDYDNLVTNWVRVDIAANISPPEHLRNDPGDSTLCDVVPARAGSTLNDMPTMVVRMKANPLFDGVRDPLPAGFTRTGNLIDGVVTGSQDPRPDRYFFDLPDTGFFYPGDVIHYYFRAEDNLGGDIGVTLVPSDTTGFSLFPGMDDYVPMRFDMDFIVRALPSMTITKAYGQPKVLFWNDATGYGGDDEWYTSLRQLSGREGVDYDNFVTKAPAAGLGNGLGGRAKPAQVAGYRTMLYTSGVLRDFTISNGDFDYDAGNDVELMRQWCYGTKNLFATGDNLAEDLAKSGVNTNLFMSDFMKISLNAKDVRPLIGNQTSPIVAPIVGNEVGLVERYYAYGGCPNSSDSDAVQPINGGVRIAEFLDAAGAAGQFPFSAATLGVEAWVGTRVISMPYDFQFIFDIPGQGGGPLPVPVRTRVMEKIMLFFGEIAGGPNTDVPGALVLGARSYPNPFNPATRIAYTLPRPGELAIRIFNVRGELVRTLFDGCVTECEGSVDWDGADDGGRSVASGAYFYQVKTDGGELFNKVMLLK